MGVGSLSEPEITLSRPGNPLEGMARCASSAWGGQLAPLSIEDAAVVVWPRMVVEGACPKSRGRFVTCTTNGLMAAASGSAPARTATRSGIAVEAPEPTCPRNAGRRRINPEASGCDSAPPPALAAASRPSLAVVGFSN